MQLCGFSRAVVELLVGGPDDHNNNDAIDLCTIDWPSSYPNGHDTPKSHLKLNQVYLPSSSSAKFDFQPYCKTTDDWSSIPERVMFTAWQVSFFLWSKTW